MSELLRKTGLAGVAVGFALGFVVDRVVQYVYVNFVPTKPVTPVMALDDWIMVAIGVLLVFTKREEVGFGWLLGALVSSYWFK